MTKSNGEAPTTGQFLANIFLDITKAAGRMDSIASRIFGALVDAKANTADKFESLVAAAYAANNWQKGGGRPAEDRETVPDAVKVYVSELRGAYGLKLPVLTYTSLEVLRRDIRTKRQKIVAKGVEGAKAPALAGVQLSSDSKLNGAVFHDLGVVYLQLGKSQRMEMEHAALRLLKRFIAPVRSLLKEMPKPTEQPASLH